MRLTTLQTKRATSRAVMANAKQGGGCVLFVEPDCFLEHDISNLSARLDDLGLDDAPLGISVWEGTFKGGEKDHFNGDYHDVYPVGTFRAPTDDEWTAIRECRNPFASPDITKQFGHADAEIRNCPYSEDVNNDSTQRCECCRECAHECAMDI